MNALVAFALASALHAGFQATVTVLVYPALADRRDDEWQAAHARHSRAIAPMVAVVYSALVISGALLVLTGPEPAGWLALTAAAGALSVTAFAAAPTHGRLTERDDALVARLVLVDRWRCAFAVGGALLAAVAVVTRAG
ncbi:MAG: hypothetical protein AVDCRST_MAG60-2321 [uncultured Nocardioides sp.]|uniref:DUF1772 domain-containing protein n=1 Tax=uncultured Nocardioides sp. TaxID=198441 RepID=A0A6J4P3A2_9ACTN|nr:MAG: hypothetical protein AVDCRST_MAG60-2321 [uncultured Nocardioides sp.]